MCFKWQKNKRNEMKTKATLHNFSSLTPLEAIMHLMVNNISISSDEYPQSIKQLYSHLEAFP